MITYDKNKYQVHGRGSGPRDLQNKAFPGRSAPSDDLINNLQSQIDALKANTQLNSTELISADSVDLNEEIRKAVYATKQSMEKEFESRLSKNAKYSDSEVKKLVDDAVTTTKKETAVELNNKLSEATLNFDKQLKLQTADVLAKNSQLLTRLSDKEKDIIRLEAEVNRLNDEIKHKVELLGLKDDLLEAGEDKDIPNSNPNLVGDSDRPQMQQIFVDPTEHKLHPSESHITVEASSSSTKKEDMQDSVNKLKSLMGGLPQR